MVVLEYFDSSLGGFCVYELEHYERATTGKLERKADIYGRVFQSSALADAPLSLAVTHNGARMQFKESAGNGWPSFLYSMQAPEAPSLLATFSNPQAITAVAAAFQGQNVNHASVFSLGGSGPGTVVTVTPQGGITQAGVSGFSADDAAISGPGDRFALIGFFQSTPAQYLAVVVVDGAIGATFPFRLGSASFVRGTNLMANGLGGALDLVEFTYDGSGIPTSATVVPGAHLNYPGFNPAAYNFMCVEASPNGQKVFASFSHPGRPARRYVWEFDRAELPGMGNLANPDGSFASKSGARRIPFVEYDDVELMGVSPDSKRLYLRTQLGYAPNPVTCAIAVFDLESNSVIATIPFVRIPERSQYSRKSFLVREKV